MATRIVRVSLPRPAGTRRKSRAQLVLTMHPRQLASIEARARAASMSVSAYVQALLDSDVEDLAVSIAVDQARAAVRRPSPFGASALASDAALVGAGMLAVVVAVPDVDQCPQCDHPEAFHGERVSGALGCDVEGCMCSITPAAWRAAVGR